MVERARSEALAALTDEQRASLAGVPPQQGAMGRQQGQDAHGGHGGHQ
jgi:hypothetical protein